MSKHEIEIMRSLDKPNVNSVTASLSNSRKTGSVNLNFVRYRTEQGKVIFEGKLFGISFLPDVTVMKITEHPKSPLLPDSLNV